MNIEQTITTLKKQKSSQRTPFGRPINEKALDSLDATISDEKNYHNEAVQCESCGFVISMLLTQIGCPNCGIEELRTKIIQ